MFDELLREIRENNKAMIKLQDGKSPKTITISEPWYKEVSEAYFVTKNGNQVLLGWHCPHIYSCGECAYCGLTLEDE